LQKIESGAVHPHAEVLARFLLWLPDAAAREGALRGLTTESGWPDGTDSQPARWAEVVCA